MHEYRGKIGSGTQKDVYLTENPDILEKRNRTPSESLRTAVASHCLNQILTRLLPQNFAKEYDVFGQEVDGEPVQNIVRRVERIRSSLLEKIIGRFLKDTLILGLQKKLEDMGCLSVLDPVPQNFILKYTDGYPTIIYIDTLNAFGYSTKKSESGHTSTQISLRTVDVPVLKEYIKKSPTAPELKEQLLALLGIYELLSKDLPVSKSHSYWRMFNKANKPGY